MFNAIRITVSPLCRLAALACLLLGVYIQDAAATSPPLLNVRVTVAPEVAPPGVTRTLTIAGTWNSGCPPVSPQLSVDAESPLTQVAVVTLLSVDPVCLSFVPYSTFSHQVQFTPGSAGVKSVYVLEQQSGYLISQGQVVTHAVGKTRSLQDLDGTWFAASSPGSALALAHGYRTNDELVGAWFLYSKGVPRWYSIQQGSWQSPTLFVGKLFEFDAPPQGCGPVVPGCPRAASAGRHFGWVRITVVNDATIKVDAHAGLTSFFDDVITTIFSGTLNRFKL
jgi:hypothetical protein